MEVDRLLMVRLWLHGNFLVPRILTFAYLSLYPFLRLCDCWLEKLNDGLKSWLDKKNFADIIMVSRSFNLFL